MIQEIIKWISENPIKSLLVVLVLFLYCIKLFVIVDVTPSSTARLNQIGEASSQVSNLPVSPTSNVVKNTLPSVIIEDSSPSSGDESDDEDEEGNFDEGDDFDQEEYNDNPVYEPVVLNEGNDGIECSSNEYNCDDFSSYAEAKKVFDYCNELGMGDIHDLDRDNDNLPCETLR